MSFDGHLKTISRIWSFLNRNLKRIQNVIESDFTRITFTVAISILEKDIDDGKVKFENKYWGVDLASEHERYLTEMGFQMPVILRNSPKRN